MVSYPLVDALVANSASTRESLRRYERPLLARSRVEAIYNGVDLDRIAAGRTRTDVPDLPPGPTVVTVATLTAQKNFEPLVRAMALVRNRVPDANLVVVGDGPQRERLEAAAAEAGIAGAVTFLGYLPEREQVYAVLDRCDVFAVTSRYEGFCNAAVEAMACALPVVASDIDVLREVVDSGGRFVDHTSPRLIAGELSRLLVDEQARTELGETAAERARTHFSLERCARAYYRLYEELTHP
jgi:glycosyltransferase involved in cell wall biosynthesis